MFASRRARPTSLRGRSKGVQTSPATGIVICGCSTKPLALVYHVPKISRALCQAVRAYDAALAEPCCDGDASIAQSNAAQAYASELWVVVYAPVPIKNWFSENQAYCC